MGEDHRREGIAESLYYSWSKEFLEAGKKRLSGDTARQASSGEVKELRHEMRDLKEALAEQVLENRLLTAAISSRLRMAATSSEFTPCISFQGALPGITRATVIELARELGIETQIRSIGQAELMRAEEVFLSGSGARLVPVGRFDTVADRIRQTAGVRTHRRRVPRVHVAPRRGQPERGSAAIFCMRMTIARTMPKLMPRRAMGPTSGQGWGRAG